MNKIYNKMKYIWIILIISIFTSSCGDEFLEIQPKGNLYPETFYSNAEELDMAVVGLYERMRRDHVYGWSLAPTMGAPDKTSTFENFEEVDVFNAQGDNAEAGNYWVQTYAAITAANSIIENYEEAEANQQQKEEAAGQAHFMRAYCYFNLVRMWNEIPLHTNTEEVSTEMEPSGSEEVYSLIVEDLKKAEEFLPVHWEEDRREGVAWTKGTAKSLLAYVYLSMAGYPINDESKYELAASKAKEVIDNESEYGYRLLDNFKDIYSWQEAWEDDANDEVVLGFFHNNSYGCRLCGMPGEYGGWNVYMAELNFYRDFPEGSRKEATFVTEFPVEGGDTLHYTELSSGHPYYWKYWDGPNVDPERPWIPRNWKNSKTMIALRHANTLLVYAEAQAMSSSPDASAYEAINRVRNRAGLPDLTEGLSKEAFRDSVVAERSWEFAGGDFAMAPWYDLVRLERVEESVQNRHPDENKIVGEVNKEDYFMPYPEEDVDKNPNLTR